MALNRTSVDAYLQDGCGRCELYRTPACKVHRWRPALDLLREIVLASGLVEEMKWGMPCYTLDGRNVAMVAAFRDFCTLQFFQGAALDDPDQLLESPGPQSRFARHLKFTSPDQVRQRSVVARRFLDQAIARERAGLMVVPVPVDETLPSEFASRLDADPILRQAFDALTPGRRRSHILHVSGAKQSETRIRRVERCAVDILAGRGFNE